MAEVSSKELYKFKKTLKELSEKKGRGTELVSVYIPHDKQISDVERRRILDEIESIDKLLAEMTNRKQLFTYIHEFFSKRTRDERAYRKLQYELEDIAMNDLYVKAAEFKLMGNT